MLLLATSVLGQAAVPTCGVSNVLGIASGVINLGAPSAPLAQDSYSLALTGFNLDLFAEVFSAFAIAGFQAASNQQYYSLVVDNIIFSNGNTQMNFTMLYTFNNIKQDNRNMLLGRDPTVDGMKTGYTDAAGYCLIATAKRDFPNGPRRLITVVVGATSKEARAVESQKLLNWGYSAWDSVKVYDARQVITQAELWKGASATAKLGTQAPVVVSVPRGEGGQLKTQLVRTDPLIAPLTKFLPLLH